MCWGTLLLFMPPQLGKATPASPELSAGVKTTAWRPLLEDLLCGSQTWCETSGYQNPLWGQGVWKAALLRDWASIQLKRGAMPFCLSLFYLSQDLFWHVVKYILSAQEILCRAAVHLNKYVFTTSSFFKTCIMCLIDWNDSLGEVQHRCRQCFVVYNTHLFYMAIYFSAGLDGKRDYEEENHMPIYELQYIKPRDWACSANELQGWYEFELYIEKSQKGKRLIPPAVLLYMFNVRWKFLYPNAVRFLWKEIQPKWLKQ